MYFTPAHIANSISKLNVVHPFHGITFLVCKKENLPVGSTIDFQLDAQTDQFLRQHHKIDPSSDWFFQPFKSIKKWVRPDYSAKGLQSVNTRGSNNPFLHERNTRIWGWKNNYVSELAAKLPQGNLIPAYHLAVWLYREKDWPKDTTGQNIVNLFYSDFHITDAEKSSLFDTSVPSDLFDTFQEEKSSWENLRTFLEPAPDAKPDQGGTLALLEIYGLGPANHFVMEPGKRLTLITGDNGLGKTFLLECAWWALTGEWADRPALPGPDSKKGKTEITFAIEGERNRVDKKTIAYDWDKLSWPQPKKRPTIPGLIVYARVDGSFAVWDPVKQVSPYESAIAGKSVYTGSEVWDGDKRIEGLIRDWVRWQRDPAKNLFETFKRVLSRLSPPDLGLLEPGDPVRIPGDPRDIPTIQHPYGLTPILYSSAGVKRIITLAYLIVWAWNEHVVAAEQARTKPQRRMVVLVDEMEAHLHPRWQRSVLPALMSINEMLNYELEAQFIVATHSPLVMASSEVVFDQERDALYHLDLSDDCKASLQPMDYARYGDVSSWLTSPVFELKHARSTEAEKAIEDAKSLQGQNDVSPDKVKEVSGRLIRYLAADDKFWPRWIAFAEKYGVNL